MSTAPSAIASRDLDHHGGVAEASSLSAAWSNAPGWRGQLTAVNHSTIGLRIVATGLGFFLVGGALAMFLRLQLAWPELAVLDARRYAQFVTLHGTTMMFLFAVPILEGFAMYLLPKMLGTRDLPFPRLSAFGYWCYLFGGLLLYSSLLIGEVPDGGWFMYPPLTGIRYSPGPATDFWLLGVTFAEIAAVAAAIELITAILATRAPGMRLDRMPLFAWYVLVTAAMIVFGFPPLILGSVLLELERAFGLVFFDPLGGGNPLLWQHLFWLFGHPEVYIIFLPAAGMVSTILPTFSDRPIVGHAWIVAAVLAMGFLSFGLWVHHMFVVGIPLIALGFFSAASMAVAIPTAVQLFAWIGTLMAGRPRLDVPMLYLLGFIAIFVIGGLTGVMLAVVPFNWQVHDTHFVVAHMHYVLIGGMLFPLLAACYYWLPLVSGRLPLYASARAGFWLVFIGFNGTFLPMHATGLMGLPRRVETYGFDLGVHWLNLASSTASFVLAAGLFTVVVDLVFSALRGARAPQNPWRAGTLEWSLPAPPPSYTFARIPVVASREPLWEAADLKVAHEHALPTARDGQREILVTHPLSARVEGVVRLPGNTWLPLLAALALAATLVLFLAKWRLAATIPFGVFLVLVAAMVWQSPRPTSGMASALQRGSRTAAPAADTVLARWGLLLFLCADTALFLSLLFAYFYLWISNADWPARDAAIPLAWALPGLLIPLAIAALAVLPRRQPMTATSRGTAVRLLVAPAAAGLAMFWHWAMAAEQIAPLHSHAAASVSWVMLGFVWTHLAVGVAGAAFIAVRCLRHGDPRWIEADTALLDRWWIYCALLAVPAWCIVHLFPAAG